MIIEFHDCVIPTYNETCSSQWDGTTIDKLVLDEIFFMFHDVIDTLKNILKIFESQG